LQSLSIDRVIKEVVLGVLYIIHYPYELCHCQADVFSIIFLRRSWSLCWSRFVYVQDSNSLLWEVSKAKMIGEATSILKDLGRSRKEVARKTKGRI